MTENEYFVTHGCTHCPSGNISRELPDGKFEEITYQDIADKLNENEKLKSDKNHLMGYLIKIHGFDDEEIDYILNRELYGEYGEVYYEWKEESEMELEE